MRALVPLSAGVAVLVAANVLNNRLAPGAYVVTCVCATALLLVLARWDGCTWADIGLGSASMRRGLRWAAVAALLVLAVFTVAALLPPVRTVFEDDRVGGADLHSTVWNVLVRIPFGTALLEETAFRGVLYAMFARRFGIPKAIALSSLAFGLWHVLPSVNLASRNAAVEALVGGGPAAPLLTVAAAIVATALGGAVFCELRRRSGSLLAPMGLHWALNGFGYIFAAVLAGTR